MPTPGGPYSGIWKLKDISKYIQDNAWPTPGDIGIFYGGTVAPGVGTNVIQEINISSLSNATDFGDLLAASRNQGGASSVSRGLFGGGNPSTNVISYITFASKGNSQDYGDLLLARDQVAGCASSSRGIFAGGYLTNIIEYTTIATTGNTTDFGDLLSPTYGIKGLSSPTRGVFYGGTTGSPYPRINVIQYVTIASTGNATDFGDLQETKSNVAGDMPASSTRGIFAGGRTPTTVNTIGYITIASVGNATDFGDLTVARFGFGSASNSKRCVFGGGTPSTNVMDYIEIATTANATDFGDLVQNTYSSLGGVSNGHGGLQ